MQANGPERKWLYHKTPNWLSTSESLYFITICCRIRGKNTLAEPGIAEELFETIEHRNKQLLWHARLVMLMPDHVHFILNFPDHGQSMISLITNWKKWTAKTLKIRWQKGFFEHRLRSQSEVDEKSHYILMNPVRAKLCSNPEDWSYVGGTHQ